MEETADLDRKLARMIGDLRGIGASLAGFLETADCLSLLSEEYPAVRAGLAPAAGPVADLRRQLLVAAATLKRLSDSLNGTKD